MARPEQGEPVYKKQYIYIYIHIYTSVVIYTYENAYFPPCAVSVVACLSSRMEVRSSQSTLVVASSRFIYLHYYRGA